MSTQTATFAFGLPEDVDTDTIILLSCPTQIGNYTTVSSGAYLYGTITETAVIDDTQWYKVQFFNSKTNLYATASEAVYGGDFANAAGFLAVSDTNAGSNYATTQDVYDYAGLTTADISPTLVGEGLKRARALIDFRTTAVDLLRFTQYFTTDISRRKYNATLRLIKEAEICFALEAIYYRLSDSRIIQNMRDATTAGSTAGSVSIGNVSAQGDSLAERSENIIYLSTLAAKYAAMGNGLLASLQQNTIELTGFDYIHRFPRFLYPFQVVR